MSVGFSKSKASAAEVITPVVATIANLAASSALSAFRLQTIVPSTVPVAAAVALNAVFSAMLALTSLMVNSAVTSVMVIIVSALVVLVSESVAVMIMI